MNDSGSRMSVATLAITEKKAVQRPGGCVGIFLQLFDWNRRFAKKKFFPKKLLPPGRTKVSKKFNADEKLPVRKHLSIADENTSGLGTIRKNVDEKRVELQAPGLVARLMGLESMPAVQQDRPSKEANCSKNGGNFAGQIIGLEKEDSNSEKRIVRHELRPQKIQKTGLSERRPVSRFGTDALQIKNVLSRSRKHHPKLASPVKSPKAGRNTYRLMDAAARILEPGIQATNRAKCAVSYSNSVIRLLKDEVAREGNLDQHLPTQSGCGLSSSPSSKVQTSCSNCGNLLVDRDFSQGLSDSISRPGIHLEKETEVVLLQSRYEPNCIPVHSSDNASAQSNIIMSNMHLSQGPDQQHFSGRMSTPENNLSSSIALKHKVQRNNGMLVGDRVPPRSKLTNMQSRRVSSASNADTHIKNFTTINRSMNGNRLRVPGKADSRTDANGRYCIGRHDSLPAQRHPVRRRRTNNAGRLIDSPASTAPLAEKRRNNKSIATMGTGSRMSNKSVNRVCLKSGLGSEDCHKDVNTVSFPFNSPARSRVGKLSLTKNMTKSDRPDVVSDNVHPRNSRIEVNSGESSPQSSLTMNGDVLGAILEQKLKELTSHVEDESAMRLAPSGRTTASILQELISALTAERPISHNDAVHGLERNDDFQSDGAIVDTASKVTARIKRCSDGFSHAGNHFSPVSVLEESFSNESCISSSIDDSSGNQLRFNCTPVPFDKLQAAYTDSDVSDSASAVAKARTTNRFVVTDLIDHISMLVQSVYIDHTRLTKTRLEYIRDVVLTCEMQFGYSGHHNSTTFIDFLFGSFLDELETLVVAAWKDSIILGIDMRKEGNALKRFILDCVIECLDFKYCKYSNYGFEAWRRRLPTQMNTEVLVEVFDEEVRKWTSLAGKAHDEIIEREMSTQMGKWTDFEIEVFEEGADIGKEILQVLVDEIVTDLSGCELSFC